MGAYNGTVPTFLAGELADADKYAEITNFMTAWTGAWTSYTPTWTVSAGSVTIGNGVLQGRYVRIGKSVTFNFTWVAGSTTTFGTAGAYWTFSLPPLGNSLSLVSWGCRLYDTGSLEYGAIAAVPVAGGSSFELFKPVSGRVLNNSPFTFASTDQIYFTGSYELA